MLFKRVSNSFFFSYLSRFLFEVDLPPLGMKGVRVRVEGEHQVETRGDKCLQKKEIKTKIKVHKNLFFAPKSEPRVIGALFIL